MSIEMHGSARIGKDAAVKNESSRAALSRWSGPVGTHRGRSPQRSVRKLKVNALALKKEMIMTTGRESRYLWQCNVARGLKAALLVVGISVVGYLGVEIARQAGPLL